MAVKYRAKEILEKLKELDSKRAEVLENQHLEFKRWSSNENDNKKNVLKAAVGFTNADGGTVVFGVENDKVGVFTACTGCPETVNTHDLNHHLYKSTDPKIQPDFEWVNAPNGQKLLLMFVHPMPSDAWPCSSTNGAYWVRISRYTEPLTGTHLRILFRKKSESISPEERPKTVAEVFVDSLAAENSHEADNSEKSLAKFAEMIMDYLIDQWLSNSGQEGNIDLIARIRSVWAGMKHYQTIAEHVVGNLQSESEDRLPAFIAASAAIAPEQAIEPIGNILKDHPNPSVRVQAVRSLVEIRDPRALELLSKHLLVEEDAGVLKELIERMEPGPDSIPGILKHLKHQSPSIRRITARVLGEVGSDDTAVVRALDEAADDSQIEVALAAIDSLKKIGGEKATSSLNKVRTDSNRPLEVSEAAIKALIELRNKQAA